MNRDLSGVASNRRTELESNLNLNEGLQTDKSLAHAINPVGSPGICDV